MHYIPSYDLAEQPGGKLRATLPLRQVLSRDTLAAPVILNSWIIYLLNHASARWRSGKTIAACPGKRFRKEQPEQW